MNLDQSIPELEPDTIRAAQLTVAHFATDADDCRNLLDMLGLAGEES